MIFIVFLTSIYVKINRNYVFVIKTIYNSCFILNLPYMIKTNDETYLTINIAKSIKCLVIKSLFSFYFFFKEDKVTINEKKKAY